MENACLSMASYLDSRKLSGPEYHDLLRNSVAKEFPGRDDIGYIGHPVHWTLMECGMEYEAVNSLDGKDDNKVHIPEGIKITREAIRDALAKYRDTITARL